MNSAGDESYLSIHYRSAYFFTLFTWGKERFESEIPIKDVSIIVAQYMSAKAAMIIMVLYHC